MILSIFPSLLSYQEFAPLLLRLTLGIVFLYWAYRKIFLKKSKKDIFYMVVNAVVGVFLVIGFLTQLAALVASLLFLVHLAKKIKNKEFLTNGINYYLILLIISLCLLLTGHISRYTNIGRKI